MMAILWFVCMCISHAYAYHLGAMSAPETSDEVQKYEIDKRYEHLRFLSWREKYNDQE